MLAGLGEQPPRGLDPVQLGHADVHQHDVGLQACGPARRRRARRWPRRPPRGRPRRRGSCGSRRARAPGRRRSAGGRSSQRSALWPSSEGSRARASRRRPRGRCRARRRRAARARACPRGRGRTRRRARCARAVVADLERRARRSADQSTVTVVGARPACLSALVRASWTIRYAARSSPAGSARRSPRNSSTVGQPGGAGAGDELADLGQRRLRRERGRLVGAVEHAEQVAHLAQRLAAGALDPRRGLERAGRVAVEDAARAAGLHDHHAHRVRDEVVHLARDPAPLVDRRLALRVLVGLREPRRGLVQLGAQPRARAHHAPGEPGDGRRSAAGRSSRRRCGRSNVDDDHRQRGDDQRQRARTPRARRGARPPRRRARA